MFKYYIHGSAEISEQQADALNRFSRIKYENDIKIYKEIFLDNSPYEVVVYNYESENHELLYHKFSHPSVSIVDVIELGEGFTFHQIHGYDSDRIADEASMGFRLYDANDNLVAHKVTEGGVLIEEHTFKELWDKNIVDDRPILEASYNEDGSLKDLITNTSLDIFIDDDDSIGYDDSPESIIALAQELDISEEFAAYFMTSEVMPDFLKAKV